MLVVVAAAAACSLSPADPAPTAPTTQPSSQPATQPAPAQGVRGKVLKVTGNLMPGPGPARRGNRTLLSVPVHVFKGPVKPIAKPDPTHPQLLVTVRSGADGAYTVPLEPGRYTVVAEIDGKLYLNSYRDSGKGVTWSTVTVKKGAWTTWNIRDTSGAAF